jgi:hypothetical protein
MLLKTGVCLLSLGLLAGCSTASKTTVSNYISPQQYSSYDCAQLAQEFQRILLRVKQLGFNWTRPLLPKNVPQFRQHPLQKFHPTCHRLTWMRTLQRIQMCRRFRS